MINIENYVSFRKDTPYTIRFLITFLVITGMRASEVFLISKNRLIYMEGVFTYRQPKTGYTRTIKLPGWFLAQTRYFRRHFGNFKTVFLDYKNMLNVCRIFVTFPYQPKRSLTFFHNCRYLFVLNLLKSGATEEQISKELGHMELSTVKTYIKHAQEIEELRKKGGKKNE